jgi:hypothetical protein
MHIYIYIYIYVCIYIYHTLDTQVLSLFNDVDMNNDGLVDYREFESALDSVKTKILSRFGDALKL